MLKSLSLLLSVLVASLLLGACGESPTTHTLRNAEQIMEESPDSALRLLHTVRPAELTNKKDNALYHLLYAQANVKLYNPKTDIDSLLMAREFFIRSAQEENLMKADFYLSELYYDKGDLVKAMEYATRAYDISLKRNDNYWHAKTSESISEIYQQVLNIDQALSYALESAHLCMSLPA